MHIGVMMGATAGTTDTIDGIVDFACNLEARGFHTAWMANIFGHDAITALALAGRATSRIRLGTAVVPTYPRHPVAMAQQALTASAASKGRFSLGIGLSHKLVIEDMFGMSYAQPARHMREYLQVLGPLLAGKPVQHAGTEYRVHAGLAVADAKPVPLIVAALGPAMLRIAGELADGTTTWMTGPRTLAGHIIPALTAAATAAGRPAPTVVAGFPIVLTADVDGARAAIAKSLQIYGTLPSYRAMLDREGAAGPADVALVGDETVLRAKLAELREIGVTDFNAAIAAATPADFQRTLDFLAGEL